MLRLLCALALALSAAPISVVLAVPHGCGDGRRWGWPGFQMGNDRWGVVLIPSKSAGQESEFVDPCNPSSNPSAIVSTTVTTVHITTLRPTTSFTSFTLAPSGGITTTESSAASSSTSSTSQSSSSSAFTTTLTGTTTTGKIPSSSQSSSTPRPPPPSSDAAPSSSSSSSAQPAPTTSNTLANSGGSGGGGGSGSNGSKASDSDVQAYLSAHNSVRAQHGASALAWNNTLATAAQKWSDGCVFQHSGGKLGPFGENLAAGTGDFSITSAVTSWTNEASQYNPSNPTASHFTQVVWKGSSQLGCAETSCAGGTIFPGGGSSKYYVCEYFPQGNVIGAFAQNVQA